MGWTEERLEAELTVAKKELEQLRKRRDRLELIAAVVWLVGTGFLFAAGVYKKTGLRGLAVLVAVLVAAVGGVFLVVWIRNSIDPNAVAEREQLRQTTLEKSRPDYAERCATTSRLIAQAYSMKDRFSDEAIAREAQLHGQSYLANEAAILAEYYNPKDPIFSAQSCKDLVKFARRHLRGMRQVPYPPEFLAEEDFSKGELELIKNLEQLHDYRFSVLCLAQALRDKKLDADARLKEEQQQQQAEKERVEAQRKAEELERKRPKSPIAEMAERFLSLAADLKEAVERVNGAQGMTDEDKAAVIEAMKAAFAEQQVRVRRKSGLVE